MDEEIKRENIAAGTVGAFLGSMLGVACIVILGQMGYVAALSGMVMAVCSLKGYEKLAGCLSKKGAVISCALILIMTWFANRLDWAVSLARALDAGIPEAFAAVGPLLEEGLIEGSAYWGNLVMLYLFTLLGAVPTVINGLKGNRQPAPLQGQDESSEREAALAGQYEFYPAQKGWLLFPRLSMLFLMFFPLAVAIVLLCVAIGRENDWNWLLAAMGALTAAFLCIFTALPISKLLRTDNLLMVRAPGGTLWQVRIDLLNMMAPYRFTPKSGLWMGLKWHHLSEEEQRAAEKSVARAIEELSLDPSYKGPMAVPLNDLAVVKEDRWRWKVTYRAHSGRKSKAIAKIYPGLSPEPGSEPPQERLAFRWGLCAASVGCTLVLTAAGWVAGGLVAGGGALSQRAETAQPSAAIAPKSTVQHSLDGITYQVDSTYLNQGGPDQYLDQATGAVFSVIVIHRADEEAAVNRLLQPISDHRMDKDFEGFRFDRVDSEAQSNLSILTAQNGASYQYNILTVHFTGGAARHVAVVLAQDGTMVVVEAAHDNRKDERAVKSALLFMLESVAIIDGGDTAAGVRITGENYQTLFSPALDLGYEHTGVAYIRAPEGMFGREAFLDAYLPYGGEIEYWDDGHGVQSTAHGMKVSVTIVEAMDAKSAVEQAFADFAASGADLYEDGVYESRYLGELDIAYKQMMFFENNRTLPRISFLYADVKQQGYYLCAQITYLPEQMDENYPALVEELSDVFALDLPLLDPMN